MFEIPIQPLSQNLAWGSGRRYKSKKYHEYETAIKAYLKKLHLPSIKHKDPFYLYLEFGIPYMQDCTNGVKIFEDLVANYLGINDRDMMAIYVRKVKCKKPDCFIRFAIVKNEYDLIKIINNEEVRL